MKLVKNIKAKLCMILCLSLVFTTACNQSVTDDVSNISSATSLVENASADLMWLEKFEGTVEIFDNDNNKIDAVEGMKLLSGYEIKTLDNSYAYINLDDSKAIKLDTKTSAKITNENKALLITLNEGALFFNVSEKLSDDETMDIKTSNLITGIRGTAGIVSVNSTIILEGEVIVTDFNQDDKMLEDNRLSAGKIANYDENDDDNVIINNISETEIPEFVKDEIDDDDELRQKIDDDGGFDSDLIINDDDDDTDDDADDDTDTDIDDEIYEEDDETHDEVENYEEDDEVESYEEDDLNNEIEIEDEVEDEEDD